MQDEQSPQSLRAASSGGLCEGENGIAIFTENDSIVAYDVAKAAVVWRRSNLNRIRYAVPLGSPGAFLAVLRNEDGEGMSIVRVTDERTAVTPITDYRRIGLPVASPDASMVAWVSEDRVGKTNLVVYRSDDLSVIASFAGPFVVDNVGPSWFNDRTGKMEFVVATSGRRISRFSEETGQTVPIVDGELPVALHVDGPVIFLRNDALWKYDFQHAAATRLCKVEKIADYYAACKASPTGDSIILRALYPSPFSGGFVKLMPTSLIIDLGTCESTPLVGAAEFEGPWAWFTMAAGVANSEE